MWPCGSSGAPHNGQGGRPAPTIRSARATNERAGVIPAGRGRDLAGRRDTAPFQLGQELGQSVGQDRDLDLLENDADDAAPLACLEEERSVAWLADGAGHEPFGWVKEVTTSGHDLTLYRFAVGPSKARGTRNKVARDRRIRISIDVWGPP